MRLQNIRFPEPDICREEELYFHRNGEWIDFNGYFNLFYIEKRKKYTNQETLTLHLEVGDCQAVRLMHDETMIREIELSGQPEPLTLEFPYQEIDKGVFWFSVKPGISSKSAVPQLSGWYEGKCQEEKPVRIAAVVCTFKREPYVLRNLKSVLRFLERPENASMNLCYWLVDNGRTLSEHEEISRLAAQHPDTIRIIPNRNVGGAGGFTRGMIEAIEEKERLGLTHVQMMDDDAVMDPELFVRAYGFLGMRKDEWEDIRLGGTLMREDYPYMCQAMGEWFERFNVTNPLVMTDMRSFENCRKPLIERPHDEYHMYSGWWCCCYSLNMVRNDNLPLPLFIHRDDIEYEVRNKETGIVFLNGFNVWHKGFEVNFLGTNAYYDTRNNLIYAALHEPELSRIYMWKWISKFLLTAIMKMRYEEAGFICQGVKDFVKGAMLIVFIVCGVHFNFYMIWIPVVLLQIYIFNIGLGLLLAQGTVFFRDIQHIYAAVLTAWNYLTPIFYPIEQLPEQVQHLIKIFNPMYSYVTQFRMIVLQGVFPDAKWIIYGFSVAIVSLLIGSVVFSKTQDKFILYI